MLKIFITACNANSFDFLDRGCSYLEQLLLMITDTISWIHVMMRMTKKGFKCSIFHNILKTIEM